jgi:hypothetical protein
MKAMAQAWLEEHLGVNAGVVVNAIHYLSATSEFQIVIEEQPVNKPAGSGLGQSYAER